MGEQIDMDAVIVELRKPKGWLKGSLGAWTLPDGAVCLRGACARVAPNELDFYEAERLLLPVIREQFPDRVPECAADYDVVPDFNDDPRTTLDDVILVCEKARAEQ